MPCSLYCCRRLRSRITRSIINSTEIQKYDGVLVDLQWRNPHILLDIATAGPDGNEQILSMEAGSIHVFQRMGIERYNCSPRAQ